MTQRPSGWYDDPHDDTQMRYWDGILWTERTMPKLRPGLDHVGEARPVELHKEQPRRDGPPREYDAHWGPEQFENRGRQNDPRSGSRPGFTNAPQGFQPGFTGVPSRVGLPGGVPSRFVAAFIDRIVVGFVTVLAAWPFMTDWMGQMQDFVNDYASAMQAGEQAPTIPDAVLAPPLGLSLALAVAMILYDTLMTTFARGRTVGKLVMGLRVVPADAPQGDPKQTVRVPLGRSFVRALVKWGPDVISLVNLLAAFATMIQAVVLFSALGTPRRQGLDDRAAGTEVRRTR